MRMRGVAVGGRAWVPTGVAGATGVAGVTGATDVTGATGVTRQVCKHPNIRLYFRCIM